MLDFLVQLDIRWFLFLNGFHNPFFDSLMHLISATGTWIPFYLILIFYIFKKQKWQGFIPLFFLVLLIVFTDQGSVHIFKNTIQRLRPCHNPDISQFVHLVNNECGGSFGFVSSHASNFFGLAAFLAMFFNNKWFSIFIFFLASIISYSRIYLGVHYVFDVLAGMLFGMLVGFLIFKLYTYTSMKVELLKKPV